MILTALVNSVSGMEIHNTKAATGGALKIQIKVSQNSRENTYVSASFLIKLHGLGLQLC